MGTGPATGKSGFTLTELLISMVVVAIGVIGFGTAVGLVSKSLLIGQRDTELSMILQGQAERLKARSPQTVADGSREDGRYRLAWSVDEGSPAKVTLAVEYGRHDGGTAADTVVFYVMR